MEENKGGEKRALPVASLSENPNFFGELLHFIGDEAQLDQLAAANSSSACGRMIKSGEQVFMCYDCGLHPYSIVCISCFHAADHKGHHYKLRGSDTGCCDCGDLLAWKKEGCCPLHKGVQNDVVLPADLESRARLAFAHLSAYFRDALEKAKKGDKSTTDEITELTEWVVFVVKKYSFLVGVLVDVITTPAAQLNTPLPSPPSLLGFIMDLDSNPDEPMDDSLRENIQDMLFHLFADGTFKRIFGTEITMRYKPLAKTLGIKKQNNYDKNSVSRSILDLNVQFLHAHEVGVILATSSLLFNILDFMHSETANKVVPSTFYPNKLVPDFTKVRELEKLLEQPQVDLEWVLQHPATARWFLYESGLFSMFLAMTGYIEDPSGIYQESPAGENEKLRKYYNLAFWISTHVPALEVGMLCGPEPLENPYENKPFTAPASPAVLMAVQKIIDSMAKEIEKIAQQKNLKLCNIEGGFTATLFDMLREPVSIISPLKRTFTSMLHRAMVTWNYSLPELLGPRAVCQPKIDATAASDYKDVFPLLLFDQVATVWAFQAQVSAGLWTKHPRGSVASNLADGYLSNAAARGNYFDKDLHTLQLCMCLIDSDQLLLMLLHRFGLRSWWNIEGEADDAPMEETLEKKLKSVANRLLMCIIMLTRNRTICSTKAENMRLELIHRLAVSSSHSALEQSMNINSDTIYTDPKFDELLQEVSTHIPPQGMEQGKYILNPECWNQWDCYFYHYTNEDKETATERYEQHCKRTGRQLPFLIPLPLPQVFSGILNILQCKTIHKIIHSSLQHLVNKSKRADQDTLRHVLHLLHLCLVYSTPAVETETAVTTGFSFSCNNIFSNSRTVLSTPKGKEKEGGTIISMILEIQKDYPSFKHAIKEILDLYSKDPQSKSIIEQTTQRAEGETSEEEKEKQRKLRQQEIMKKFAEQQNAFLAAKISDAGGVEDEEIATASVTPYKAGPSGLVCVMCREDTKSADNPFGYIALVSKSDLLHAHLENRWEKFAVEKARVEEQLGLALSTATKSPEKPKSTIAATDKTEASVATDTSTTTTETSKPTEITPDTVEEAMQKTTKQLVSCMFADNELVKGVSIVSCRHVLHQQCYKQYTTTLATKYARGHPFEGENEINVPKGEFLCPLCKALANNLVPIMPEIEPSSAEAQTSPMDNSISELVSNMKEMRLDQLTNKANLSVLDFGINISVDTTDFAESVHNYMKAKFKNIATKITGLSLFDAVINNISHYELAARDSNKLLLDFTTTHQNEFLRNLAMVSIYHASNSPPLATIRQAFISTLSTILIAEPNEQLDTIPPFLKLNLFDVFVRYILIVSHTGRICSFNDAHPFALAAYYSTVIQAICSLICPNMTTRVTWQQTEIKSTSSLVEELKSRNSCNTSTESILEQIPHLCLPLLRRIGLFVRVCMQQSEVSPRRNFAAPNDEFQYWLEYLQLPSLDGLFISDNSMQQMASRWLSHASRSTKPEFKTLVVPTPFKLIDLPTQYTDLFSTFVNAKCAACNTVPVYPSLCLVCGMLVCTGAKCCTKRDTGECVQHTKKCGAGLGIFLNLQLQYIIFIRKGSCSRWGSVYLDKYGEEDYELKQGRKLVLSEQRYAQLRGLWVNKSLEVLLHQNKHFANPHDARLF